MSTRHRWGEETKRFTWVCRRCQCTKQMGLHWKATYTSKDGVTSRKAPPCLSDEDRSDLEGARTALQVFRDSGERAIPLAEVNPGDHDEGER